MIEACESVKQAGWLPLRRLLWPDESEAGHLAEMTAFIDQPARYAQFMAYDESRRPVGFVEASIRSDHVNGTETSPVAFLEGIYVLPDHRRRGFARALLAAHVDLATLVRAQHATHVVPDLQFDARERNARGAEPPARRPKPGFGR